MEQVNIKDNLKFIISQQIENCVKLLEKLLNTLNLSHYCRSVTNSSYSAHALEHSSSWSLALPYERSCHFYYPWPHLKLALDNMASFRGWAICSAYFDDHRRVGAQDYFWFWIASLLSEASLAVFNTLLNMTNSNHHIVLIFCPSPSCFSTINKFISHKNQGTMLIVNSLGIHHLQIIVAWFYQMFCHMDHLLSSSIR